MSAESDLRQRLAKSERKIEKLADAIARLTDQLAAERTFYREEVAPAVNKLIAGANVATLDVVTTTAFLDGQFPGWDVEIRKAVAAAARQQSLAVEGRAVLPVGSFDSDRAYAEHLVNLVMDRFQQRVAVRLATGQTPPRPPEVPDDRLHPEEP